MNRTFLKILEELDWPPIYLVHEKQFEMTEGDKLQGDFGMSSCESRVITIRKGLRGRVLKNVLYHEAGHVLFPSKPHWWIENFAEVMARGGGRGYWAKKYGKPVEDMPPRARLLALARRASRRLKGRL